MAPVSEKRTSPSRCPTWRVYAASKMNWSIMTAQTVQVLGQLYVADCILIACGWLEIAPGRQEEEVEPTVLI